MKIIKLRDRSKKSPDNCTTNIEHGFRNMDGLIIIKTLIVICMLIQVLY